MDSDKSDNSVQSASEEYTIIELLGADSETTGERLGINKNEDETEYLQLYLIPSPNPDNSECHIFVLGAAERLHYISSFDLADFDAPEEHAALFEAQPTREADKRQ